MARRSTARPLPAWVGDLPVFERTLGNGLKALVLPRTHAPVVVCDLYYPVGSVNEPAGRSGLAHFVEHMLFKGTERFPKGQIDRLAFLGAGLSNAETGEDCTHYWFAFPTDRWELALAVEADRMHGAVFDPDEVEAERRVIVEERARELDSPTGRLEQTHLAVSYLIHPYRNPILGWPEELRRISVTDLRDFYATHYRPDGAVLVVVGDLDADRALDRVEAHFGKLERGRVDRPGPPPVEPKQVGRREFRIVESEGVARGMFGWHSVARNHPDGPALDVLSDLLTCGRRSRLWDRLVERKRLATWVEASQEGSHLAGEFLVHVEAAPGVEPDRIEAEIRLEIEQLSQVGPTPEELSRSRNRLEAAWRWEQEDLAGLASGLGHVALWDDWRAWQAEHRAALAIKADDIRRVASTYLIESGLTVGWSLPRPGGETGAVLLPFSPIAEPSKPVIKPVPEQPIALAIPTAAARLVDYRPRRALLANGLRLLTERRPGSGTVALELFCDAGVLREARPGLAHLTGRLREEGTLNRSAEALAEAVEDVGGVLDLHATGASIRMRAEDLPLAIEILADLTLRPAFPADDFAWTKRRIAADRQADREDPAFRAGQVFLQLVYGDHPYGRDPRGNARQLAALTLDDVRRHNARYFTPDNGVLVVVGDFEPSRLRALLKTHLGRWAPSGHPREPLPPLDLHRRPKVRRISHPGEQVHVLIGHLGITRFDPDYDALTILDHILGTGPGFTDRLSRLLRDDLGLAYSVSGSIAESADLVPGTLRIYLGTSPGEVDRAVNAVIEQLEALHRGEIRDDEVEHARRYLAGSWVFDYQTVAQRAERLLELERWGLPLDEPLRWPERVSQITPDQVRDAARRHLHPAALTRVEFGPIPRRRRRANG